MKKTFVVALFALLAIGANAADKKEGATSNKPVFTVVKQIPITSIKDQNRSGTCWDYSTLSYFEAEILKKTGIDASLLWFSFDKLWCSDLS